VAQQVAVAETAMAVLRKRRMIRHRVRQIETAKPAIRQVQMHLITQPPLRPDAEAIANQEHPDQQFRINRGAAGIAVKWRQVLANTGQFNDRAKPPLEG
jgi:hypothetical protein